MWSFPDTPDEENGLIDFSRPHTKGPAAGTTEVYGSRGSGYAASRAVTLPARMTRTCTMTAFSTAVPIMMGRYVMTNAP
jgi:hypothetical protein